MEAFINFFFSAKLILFTLPFSLIFSWRQEKRSFFWMRCLSFMAVAAALHYFIWEWLKPLGGHPFYLLIIVLFIGYCFLVVLVFNQFCFRCNIFESLLFAIGAFTAEHFANCFSVVLGLLFNFEGVHYRPYSVEYFLSTLTVYLLTFAFTFSLFFFWVKERKLNINKRNLIIPTAAIFSIFAYLNYWVNYTYFFNNDVLLSTKIYGAAFSLVLLFFIVNLFESSHYRVEIEVLEQLERKGREQYEISKDTIELINAKCHDIKKLLRAALPGGNILTQAEVQSLQEKISIFDSLYATESDTLNIVLNEKSLYCEKNGIELSVIASYSQFDFMSKMDIYSLFGNILDNAIEAVMQLSQEKRIVALSIKKVGTMLIVHSDNPFTGEVHLSGLSIATSKKDKTVHGYGLLSIRRVVEKYGGALKLRAEDNLFSLDICIPLSA